MGGLFRGSGEDDDENDCDVDQLQAPDVQADGASAFVEIGGTALPSSHYDTREAPIPGFSTQPAPQSRLRDATGERSSPRDCSDAPPAQGVTHHPDRRILRIGEETRAGSFVVSTAVRPQSFARLPRLSSRLIRRGESRVRMLVTDGDAGGALASHDQGSPAQHSPRLHSVALASNTRVEADGGGPEREQSDTRSPLRPVHSPFLDTVVGESSEESDDIVLAQNKVDGSNSQSGVEPGVSAGSMPTQRTQHCARESPQQASAKEESRASRQLIRTADAVAHPVDAGMAFASDAVLSGAKGDVPCALVLPSSLSPPFKLGAGSPPSSPPTAADLGTTEANPLSASNRASARVELSSTEVGGSSLLHAGIAAPDASLLAVDAGVVSAQDAAKAALVAPQPPPWGGASSGVIGAARQLFSTYTATAGSGQTASSQALPGFADEIRRVQSERARAAALASGGPQHPTGLHRAPSSRLLGTGGEGAAAALASNSTKLRLGGRGIELSPGASAMMSMGSTSTATAAAAAVIEVEERVLEDVAAGRMTSAAHGVPRQTSAVVTSPSRAALSGHAAPSQFLPTRRLSLLSTPAGQSSPGSRQHRRRSSQPLGPLDGHDAAAAGLDPLRGGGGSLSTGAPSGPHLFGDTGARATAGAAANVRAAKLQRARQLVLRQTLDSLFALATEMQVSSGKGCGREGWGSCPFFLLPTAPLPFTPARMKDVLRDVNAQLGVNVRMRVGVHVGWVVTGVVGRTRPRFHVYGPAVLTAEKMEQTGREGLIHCSPEAEAAYSASDFGFRPAAPIVAARQAPATTAPRAGRFSTLGNPASATPGDSSSSALPIATSAPPALAPPPSVVFSAPASSSPPALAAPATLVMGGLSGRDADALLSAAKCTDANLLGFDARAPPPAPPTRLAIRIEGPSTTKYAPLHSVPGPGRSNPATGRTSGEVQHDRVLGGTPVVMRLSRSLSSRSLRASAPPLPGVGGMASELRPVPEGADERGANSAVRAFFSPLLAAAGADTPPRSVRLPNAIASDCAAAGTRAALGSDSSGAGAGTPASGDVATARQLRNEFEVAATFGA